MPLDKRASGACQEIHFLFSNLVFFPLNFYEPHYCNSLATSHLVLAFNKKVKIKIFFVSEYGSVDRRGGLEMKKKGVIDD